MKFTMETGGGYVIRAHAPGRIAIAYPAPEDQSNVVSLDRQRRMLEETLTRSFIITPSAVVRDWPPQSIDDLTEDHLTTIRQLQPEIALFGTGTRLRFPPRTLFAEFYRHNIGVEIMDTGAACRTYNVLLAEGRKVVAALLV